MNTMTSNTQNKTEHTESRRTCDLPTEDEIGVWTEQEHEAVEAEAVEAEERRQDIAHGEELCGVGGAAVGAMAGSLVGPVGVLAGAIIGGVAGAFAGGIAVYAADKIEHHAA